MRRRKRVPHRRNSQRRAWEDREGESTVSVVKGMSRSKGRWRGGWGPTRAGREEESVDFTPAALGIHRRLGAGP